MAVQGPACDLPDPSAIEKYQIAAQIANEVMNQLIVEAVPEKRIFDLCELGDRLIIKLADEACSSGDKKKIKRGVAFPTCISVNECIGHFCPGENNQDTLKKGQVAKIDLGVHIDGFISQCAHTVVIAQDDESPLTGRAADAICAAYYSAECAARLIRPGNTNTQVTCMIDKVASAFRCTPMEGVLSHQLKQHVIDANKVIMNKLSTSDQVHEITFEVNEAYCVDIVISTEEGKSRQRDAPTTIYKRAVDQVYNLKLQSSRAVLSEINKNFRTMPFATRSLKDKKAKFGIIELISHNMLHPYPVLYEKNGAFVAQIKFTILLLQDGQYRLNEFNAPYVSSQYSISEYPEIASILEEPNAERDQEAEIDPEVSAEP
ncbi:uncharacterized protein LOC126322409 [Schistocerca gregaria]|uniref:uncharacterized protein LOC126322409 n=1 Tax=Schistocerca gregaria TaxID=7010 RepID=UPI00211DD7AF|nr:uncharacterized protein LOC126322409 [Schistocerca gregaria]